MANSDAAATYVEWREGAVVIAAMLVGAVAGGAGLYFLEVPFGWLIGAVLGALTVFLAYSYLRFGR